MSSKSFTLLLLMGLIMTCVFPGVGTPRTLGSDLTYWSRMSRTDSGSHTGGYIGLLMADLLPGIHQVSPVCGSIYGIFIYWSRYGTPAREVFMAEHLLREF